VLRLKMFGGLSISRDGAPVEGAGAQRRRLALLALLAAAGERGVSRERILALLWPESDLERARKSLAQAVYALRRELGDENLVAGTTDLRVGSDTFTSDLAEFRTALAEGRPEDAVALYDGPFLDGVYIDEAPEFERWADSERNILSHDYVAALEQLATRADRASEHRAAVGWWRRLANADPLNARVALGLMRALAAQGDRGGALQHYRVYETLLRQELDLTPDLELSRFADQLRSQQAVRPTAVAPAPSGSPSPPSPATPPSGAPPPARSAPAEVPPTTLPRAPAMTGVEARTGPPARPSARAAAPRPSWHGHTDEYARPRPWGEWAPPAPAAPAQTRRPPLLARRSTRYGILIGFVLGGALAITLMLRVGGKRPAAQEPPVIAVGLFRDYTRGQQGLSRPLADMLATNLARARGISVISMARMYELMAQEGETHDSIAAVMSAARTAGAAELIDGALLDSAGTLRLDLRRTDLGTGGMRSSTSVEGADLFALVEAGTRELVRSYGATGPTGQLADVSTRSLAAYGLYEKGLREYFANRLPSAASLFDQALQADSLFAMAAYFRALTVPIIGGAISPRLSLLQRALRLAAHAPDRERLLITCSYYLESNDPRAVAVAETLTVRYPEEVEGHAFLGQALEARGDFMPAITAFQRAIALDSASLLADPVGPNAPIRCLACEALGHLVGIYRWLDSVPAAERIARDWTRRQPGSAVAWSWFTGTMQAAGRWEEALSASNTIAALDPEGDHLGPRAVTLFLAGRYDEADRIMEARTHGSHDEAASTYWWLIRSLRTQGRLRDAMEAAHRLRALGTPPARRDAAPYEALMEGAVLYEMGRFREAAALFDSVSRAVQPGELPLPRVARHIAWTETLRATALAAAGDTVLLAALADSVGRWAGQTGLGRDHRLPHHIRGLLLAARGRKWEAETEFRAALLAPAVGYTRTNVELARVLLAENRPLEAAAIARAPLWDSFDGPQSYVMQTELCELTALAFDAAGRRDSALAYYRHVVRNWRNADPELQPRIERARLRIAALSGH
jgi:DNA-binding SARP family transcriptional activator/TolB-like protein